MLYETAELFYSVKLRRNLSDGSERVPFGAAHYSYGAVADKFVTALRRLNVSLRELARPEIYPPLKPDGRRPLHLCFKPYEEIRLLHGALNIAHVAWEFAKLPHRADWPLGDPRRLNPFSDYLHMIKIPDRVWVGCEYTKNVFLKYGVANVDVVPAPIQTPIPLERGFAEVRSIARSIALHRIADLDVIKLDGRVAQRPAPFLIEQNRVKLGEALKDSRNVFVTVANPGDLRKNLPAIIDGFSLAAQRTPGLTLILKATIESSIESVRTVISETLPKRYSEQERTFGDITPTGVYILAERLSDDDLLALQASADFYLSAAIAEGQNLPLQEAMSVGTVPIAPANTAMADYIVPENAIVVPFSLRRAPACFESAYGLGEIEAPWVTSEAVAAAVETAAAASPQQRAERGRAAWETMKSHYSGAILARRIAELCC